MALEPTAAGVQQPVIRPRVRSWACTCGAAIVVPAWCPDQTWLDLQGTFAEGHSGPGHATCDLATAARARANAERRRHRVQVTDKDQPAATRGANNHD